MGFKIASERAGHFKEPVRTIGSAAQSLFPTTSIYDYLHPYRQARATANTSGTTYFGLDFGATFTPAAIIVGNVNVNSIKIQGNATDSWGTPSRDSGALTVPQDPLTGRYNYIYEPSSWSTNTRYLRVVSNTGTTTDGTGVFALGYMLALGTLTTLATPFTDPLDEAPLEATLANDLVGGSSEVVTIGKVRAEFQLAQSAFPNDNDAEIYALLRREGEGGAFVLFQNNNDRSRVYVVHRRGRSAISHLSPNLRRVSGILLQEYV